MIGIYKITNTINKKVYIGQSINIEKRWISHRTRPFNSLSDDYNKPLYRAIRKYGLENFIFEVVEECLIEELNDKEIKWIEDLDTTNPSYGYNLTKGGNFHIPTKLTEQQCDEIINLLANTDKTQEEIAMRFNISQRMVSSINLGECWVRQNIIYPIRTSKNFCISCGVKITYGSKLCLKCNGIKNRKTEHPSREELKQLIRSNSFVEIGKMFGVSDNAIRRWCVSMNLPSKKKDIKTYSNEDWKLI